MSRSRIDSAMLAAAVGWSLLGCSIGRPAPQITIDGSSTVFPITEAVAEAYREVDPQVRVTVGFSGTGGGMQRFAHGEIDICNASREISPEEQQSAQENGIEYVAFAIAYDGLAVVVHPDNDWCDCLTVGQLKELWRPQSPIVTWRDLNPDWPAEEIRLYGPGTDSGTFDYFTSAIVGEARACRADFTASEDDNVLASGVQVDPYALGYFGFAFYRENQERLKLLGVDAGAGCVLPSEPSVRDGTYVPLSRPLFIYVRRAAFKRRAVTSFVRFFVEHAGELAREVGYMPVPDETARRNGEILDEVAVTKRDQ